jgi:hypothetical protein
MKKLILAAFFLTAIACQKKEQTEKTGAVIDEHSYSKPELAVVKHLDLDIKVDFDTQTISGKLPGQLTISVKEMKLFSIKTRLILPK